MAFLLDTGFISPKNFVVAAAFAPVIGLQEPSREHLGLLPPQSWERQDVIHSSIQTKLIDLNRAPLVILC